MQANPWAMISASPIVLIPLIRTRSSNVLKGRKVSISAARTGPMCLILSSSSAKAELMST